MALRPRLYGQDHGAPDVSDRTRLVGGDPNLVMDLMAPIEVTTPISTGARDMICGRCLRAVMDLPGTLFAAGLPFRFDSYQANGHVESGVPANGEFFIS